MIPRLIHRVWLGSDPMPEEFEHYAETWRAHHPDWEMRLWTDTNLPELRFPEALERCRNHGERSDVLRNEVLLRHGGLYVDTDVECKRPIEPLIGDAPAFAAWVRPGRIGSAVMGAVPGHPAVERLLTEMQQRVGTGSQIDATVALLTEVFSEASDVTVFDSETFYPYHPRHNPAEPGDDFAGSYAVHHWGLTWKSKDDLRDRVRGLRNKLEEASAEGQELKRRNRRLRRERDELSEELRRTRSRLAAIEGSGLWRLRRGVGGALRPARPLLRRVRGRAG
ncbi:MAG TPA: glycosyltransferase [Thermoleophilaceae bacterium]|nr:glycosyltransferase [Thermoleophilaceae bacterium]